MKPIYKIVPAVRIEEYVTLEEQLNAPPDPAGFAALLRGSIRRDDLAPIVIEAARDLGVTPEALAGALMKAAKKHQAPLPKSFSYYPGGDNALLP